MKTFGFHSYKGGTGKTSIAANIAVIYAKQGHGTCILDYDFRAPSLHILFKTVPKHWLNEFLDAKCEIQDALVDLSGRYGLKGKLLAGFANPSIEELRNMMTKDRRWEMKALQRTLSAKRKIHGELGVEYLMFDTGPGVQYSSINALAGSDVISLVMKADDFDIEGAKEMSKGIYEALGRKTGLVLNKIPQEQIVLGGGLEKFSNSIERLLGFQLLGIIPCFCELMATGGKLIYALDKPDHIFTKSLFEISERLASF